MSETKVRVAIRLTSVTAAKLTAITARLHQIKNDLGPNLTDWPPFVAGVHAEGPSHFCVYLPALTPDQVDFVLGALK
jgi:hypothetical protein